MGLLFLKILLDIRAFGDELAEVCGPVFTGVLLHLLVLFIIRVAGRDQAGGEGLIGRGLDTHGERSGSARGVLGFVAADGVSEGVFGDGPGAVEGVAAG